MQTALHRSVGDGDSGKTVLKMLIRRLKEVGQERISSGSFAVNVDFARTLWTGVTKYLLLAGGTENSGGRSPTLLNSMLFSFP